MVRYLSMSFFACCLLGFVSKVWGQSLGSLSDQELSKFVLDADSGSEYGKHFCYWRQLGDRTRLGVRFLPNCLSVTEKEVSEIEFDRWCAEQMRLGGHDAKNVAKTLVEIVGVDVAISETADILSSFLARLPFDIDQSRQIRAVAMLTSTAKEMSEIRDGLCLLLLLLAVDKQSANANSQGFQSLIAYLESVSQTAVLARLVSLNTELQRTQFVDPARLKSCFDCLQRGRFAAPFLLEKGDQDQIRLLDCDPVLESHRVSRPFVYRWTSKTTEFEIHEDFRSGRMDSLARSTRNRFFASLFENLKNHLDSLAQKDRITFLNQYRKQIELLCARSMQCDGVVEILESRSHFCSLVRIVGDDLSADPTYSSAEWEECGKLLEPSLIVPEFIGGRRTFDFYRACHAIAEIGRAWENKLIENP